MFNFIFVIFCCYFFLVFNICFGKEASHSIGLDVGYIKAESFNEDLQSSNFQLDKAGGNVSFFFRGDFVSQTNYELSVDYFSLKGEKEGVRESVQHFLGGIKLDHLFVFEMVSIGPFVKVHYGYNAYHRYLGSDDSVLGVNLSGGVAAHLKLDSFMNSTLRLQVGSSFVSEDYMTGYSMVGISIPYGNVFESISSRVKKIVSYDSRSKIKRSIRVFFHTGSSVINGKENHKKLKTLLDYILTNKERIKLVIIEGHTDHFGTEEANYSLAEKRVGSVVRYYIKNGVSSSKLVSSVHGESKSYKGNREVNHGSYRMVEFSIILK